MSGKAGVWLFPPGWGLVEHGGQVSFKPALARIPAHDCRRPDFAVVKIHAIIQSILAAIIYDFTLKTAPVVHAFVHINASVKAGQRRMFHGNISQYDFCDAGIKVQVFKPVVIHKILCRPDDFLEIGDPGKHG